MKKILAMVLAMVLMLSAAALAEGTVSVTLSDVQFVSADETFVLNPAVTATMGATDTSAWVELTASVNGEAVIVGQLQVVDNTLYASVDGANDALVINDFDAQMAAYGADTTSADFIDAVNTLVALEDGSDDLDSIIEEFNAEQEGVTLEKVADNQVKFTIAVEDDCDITFVLTVEGSDVAEFADLSAKNAVELTEEDIANGTTPDSDVITVAAEKLTTLMSEESVAAMIAAISEAGTEEAA